MPSDLSNDMLRRVWRRADEITLAEHPGEQPAGEWDEVPQQHRGVFRSIVQATSEELRAAHADARRLAELVLRIRAAVRERGYLYVESSDLYRDLDAAEELAAAIDAAMAADTQTHYPPNAWHKPAAEDLEGGSDG